MLNDNARHGTHGFPFAGHITSRSSIEDPTLSHFWFVSTILPI